MISPRILALSLALPLAIACPAMAQTNEGHQAAVSIKGLDLNTRDGAVLFLKRLDAAAARACGSAPDIRELERADAFNTCLAQAKANGIARLNNPQVSALAHGARQQAAVSPGQPKT